LGQYCTAMSYKHILFDNEGAVARITLNRPESANGINVELAHELMLAAIECDESSDIRAVLLTGSGKMFCAGGDLKSFVDFGDRLPHKLKELTTYLHAATSRFARMRAPMIAAVNGVAAGAGFSFAVASDLVVASEKAMFTMAYTAAGLAPDGSSSYFLPRLIGLRRTQELMLTNRRLSAEEALDWGLVNQVVPAEELMPASEALATQLASGATESLGQVKKLLIESFGQTLEGQMELEARGIAAMSQTPDGREGISAFLEKRKPSFGG
jgi:2-(1,2-epoxy-1,2-dihydrophenyl)acetyl-CoA isomerase